MDMIQIKELFLCDYLKEGQFGKVDILGLNPTNMLSLSQTPYNLLSNLVIIGDTDEQFEDLSLNVHFENEWKSIVDEISSDLPGPTKKPNLVVPLFLVQPIKILINHFGVMKVSILHKKTIIHSKQYDILQGASPYTGIQEHIPASEIFQGNEQDDVNFVINLLSTAHQSLKIFDSYTDPKSLKQLLSKVPKTTKIEIVTFPENKKLFLLDQSFSKLLPNTEVRISRALHDRFVIINDSEYYHFGHSLKAIANKKISRFSKITTKDEIIKLEKIWSNTWKAATKI